MTTADIYIPADVLDFWFEGDPAVWRPHWFNRDDAFDARIRARFASLVVAARDDAYPDWPATIHGALALIIALDQFPRNLHRGSPLAFAGDGRARRIALANLDRAERLTPVERVFLYLPFEHSESLADQDRAVALFETLRGGDLDRTIEFAERHRDVIRRFGRFPHRNRALGRLSTPAEAAYLAEPGAGF